MNEEREKRFQPKLPGLESTSVYEKIGVEKPVLTPLEGDHTEDETKPTKPVKDEPETRSHSPYAPNLATIHEDREERDEMYRRN